MKNILAIVTFLSVLGCGSTYQDLTQKYIKSDNQKKAPIQQKAMTHKLFVNATPADSRIYITNIKPKFKQGIELENGQYTIKIKKQGYQTVLKTVNFTQNNQDKTLNIELKQDELAFNTTKNVRKITNYLDYGRTYYRLFDKHSLSMAMAALLEWNNGESKYPYTRPHTFSPQVLDIKKSMFEDYFEGIDDDLYYQRNLEIVKKYEDKANQKIEKLRPKAREYLDSMYVIKLKLSYDNEEFAKLYDNEDKVFTPTIKWSMGLGRDSDFFVRKSHNMMAKELRNKYPGNIKKLFYKGKMDKVKLSVKDISLEEILKYWEKAPKSRHRNERDFEVEVLTKISNVVINPTDDHQIVFSFEPVQFRFKGLNVKQDI